MPYDVCGAGSVSSATTEGIATPASGPNTATELENTKRGAAAPLTLRRKASSSARVLSRLERKPRSKSASHSPETAEAR